VTWVGASSNVNVLERRASQLAGRSVSAKSTRSELCGLETTNVIAEPVTGRWRLKPKRKQQSSALFGATGVREAAREGKKGRHRIALP
jgi:hypothetical protein